MKPHHVVKYILFGHHYPTIPMFVIRLYIKAKDQSMAHTVTSLQIQKKDCLIYRTQTVGYIPKVLTYMIGEIQGALPSVILTSEFR